MLRAATRVQSLGRRSFGSSARRGRIPARRDVTEADLVKLLGSREAVEEAMKDEEEDPEDDKLEVLEHFPHRPRYLMPLPEKGTYNAKLYRQSPAVLIQCILRRKDRRSFASSSLSVTRERPKPVPWNSEVDLRPKEPFVYFPPQRDPFCESYTYRWQRQDYIPGIGDIYPDKDVHVSVTLTNDVDASETWAQERLEGGDQIYGMETKWWTWEHVGHYYSDSYPGMWSDLALLQLATEREVLLLQPLDLPVERIGPRLRQLLKYKYLKKASFRMEAKAKALKMCEVKVHGCHDFGHLLKLQLGLEHVEDLPINLEHQDLSSMAKLLLGLDINSKEACAAHWERPYLEERWVELAAKEAWACRALYGVLTRMEASHVELWNASLPDGFRSSNLSENQMKRKRLLKQHGTQLMNAASIDRPANWKVAKQSAVELACDLGLDLQRKI